MNKRLLKSTYESLTVNQQVVLLVLQNATWNGAEVTNIKIDTIGERTGMSIKAIKGHLKQLEEKGYITTTERGYKLLKKAHFEYYCPEALSLVSYKTLAIANRLAHCRKRGTSKIYLSRTEVLDTIGIGMQAYKAVLKELKEQGLYTKYKDCSELSPEYWPVVKKGLTAAYKERADMLLKVAFSKTFVLGAKVFHYYWKDNFDGLKMTPDQLVVYCEAGCPGMNKLAAKQLGRYEIPEEYDCEQDDNPVAL